MERKGGIDALHRFFSSSCHTYASFSKIRVDTPTRKVAGSPRRSGQQLFGGAVLLDDVGVTHLTHDSRPTTHDQLKSIPVQKWRQTLKKMTTSTTTSIADPATQSVRYEKYFFVSLSRLSSLINKVQGSALPHPIEILYMYWKDGNVV